MQSSKRPRRELACRECRLAFVDGAQLTTHVLHEHAGKMECECGSWVLGSSMRSHAFSQRHARRMLDVPAAGSASTSRDASGAARDDDDDAVGGGVGSGGEPHDPDDDVPLRARPPQDGVVDTHLLDSIGSVDDVADGVKRFFESAAAPDVLPRPFDPTLVARVQGPTVAKLAGKALEYSNASTLALAELLVDNRCSREFSESLCAFVHTLEPNVPAHWATVESVLHGAFAVVPTKHDDVLDISYRDPLDLMVSVLRDRFQYEFPYDPLAVDSVCSRPFYGQFAEHFGPAIAAGFKLQMVDIYFDEFESTKAHKKCALRVRFSGTTQWFEVAEIDCRHISRETLKVAQHRLLQRVVMPSIEKLSRGIIIEAYDGVPALHRVGSVYMFVGDMIARQDMLMLRKHIAPMTMPGAVERVADVALGVRPLSAHVALIEWAAERIGARQDVTIARAVLNAAGCAPRGDTDIVLAHHEFGKLRQLGSLLIGPDPMHQHCGMIGHLMKHTINHYDKSYINAVNDAVRNYPKHPNIISQSRVVQGFTSKETRRWTIGLLPLTSEETCQLLWLLPEVLLVAGIEEQYIKPFVKFNAYIKALGELSHKPGQSAAALSVRAKLGEFYTLVRSLDYRSHAAMRVAAHAADNENEGDDDDDGDGDGDDANAGDDVVDAVGRITWDFPKARDEPSSAEMVVNVAPLSICSTRMAEQGHQKVKFFGSKRSNFAGDRECALLARVSMHEAVRAAIDTPQSTSARRCDRRALGPIHVADNAQEFPRRCRVLPDGFRDELHDANATCFKGLWLDHHRVYLGSFLYVTSTDANNVTTHRIGALDAVIARDVDAHNTLLLLKLYAASDDCRVTELPLLRRQGVAYEYVSLAAGVIVQHICVTNIAGVLRWNERVPPVIVAVRAARRIDE